MKSQPNAVVYIVDDDSSVRDALYSLVQTMGLEPIACSHSSEFLKIYRKDKVGCLILDIRMPDINGLDFLESLSGFDINIPTIMISGHGDIKGSVRAMKAGAIDFIEKPFRRNNLLEKILYCIEQDEQKRINDNEFRDFEHRLSSLSVREHEVVDLLVQGYSYKKIACMLQISHRTVEVHRKNCMLKLHLDTTIELVKSMTKYIDYKEHKLSLN